MQIYQCPNCGRTFSEFENIYYCPVCNYRLVKQEDIKEIKHPELSDRDEHIIGELPDPTKPNVACPYCTSSNIKKISSSSRWLSIGMLGIFSNKIGKNFHCNNCGANF